MEQSNSHIIKKIIITLIFLIGVILSLTFIPKFIINYKNYNEYVENRLDENGAIIF